MRTSELTGAALDWAVCEATGLLKAYTQFRSGKNFLKVYGVARNRHLHPSTDWSQGGPIIEREGLQPSCQEAGKFVGQWGCNKWVTNTQGANVAISKYGETLLIAAMRCYVASKLGDNIEIPEELT